MDLGFETCGNATLIVYDHGKPVMVTDPWITEPQYFGSWALPYLFSDTQLEAFRVVPYVWLSHGHPDHLNLASLECFRDRIILVPQHYGGRISADLKAGGFRVKDLQQGVWLPLSARVQILTVADWNQDAAVLIALGRGCAVLNLNDGSAIGTRAGLQSSFRTFQRRFLLGLVNYGDADMMNYFTEGGERVTPLCADKAPLGQIYGSRLKLWGGTHTAPFSCHHTYARSDSRWASDYETPLEAHGEHFNHARGEFIPGFFRYDVASDRITLTSARRTPRRIREPREFGDDWSEVLEPADIRALQKYFLKFEHLRESFEFVNLRVGRGDNVIDLGGPKGRGITFEAPRTSLMSAVRNEIFDDLLIGNFVKTTLHGGVRSLYPDFTPYVAKYGDNGRAFCNAQLSQYFAAYCGGSSFQGWLNRLRLDSARRMRTILAANRSTFLGARRAYRYLKS